MAKASRSIVLPALIALGSLGAMACSSGPTCIVGGVEEPVGKPFSLLGCGSCMCDSSGNVTCANPACSSNADGAASDGAEASAD
jgi:hypothetical protein